MYKEKSTLPTSKLSSLTVVDELISRLVRGSTEEIPYFRFDLPLTPANAAIVKVLGLIRQKRDVWTIKGSMVMSSLYFCRSTYEVLNDALPKFFKLPLEDQLELFYVSSQWSRSTFVKHAKYFTAWPLARYNHQGDELERPETFVGHPLVFKGAARRMLKQRLVSHNKKNLHLWGSFLQGIKRGCYVVPEDFIQTSYEKHRNQMLTPPNCGVDQILGKFSETIDMALGQVPSIRNYKLFEASTSASFEKKRDEGGAREVVKEFYDECLRNIDLDDALDEEDISIEDRKTIKSSNIQRTLFLYDYAFKHMADLYGCLEDEDRPLKVMVHGICEPLKVRIITKGEAIPYWIARHAQKEMWGYLQNFPQFSATGRPLESSDIYMIDERRKNLENKLNVKFNFDKWVSGDYSAATDGVNIHMTMAVFDRFVERLNIPTAIVRVIRRVIGPQEVHYPPKSGLEPVLQQNGQLMGSVLSFPILCIINIVAYWLAMNEYLSELNCEFRIEDMKDLPVMVNGDDILFPANDEFYEFWKKNVGIAGFKLSLGKNYISKDFLTINSVLYQIKRVVNEDSYEFTEVPTFNTGLLTGQSKLTARSETRMLPIWDIYNEVMEGAARPSVAKRRFFHYNRKLIEKLTKNGLFNCFLPHELGGLGFSTKFCEPHEVEITKFQRKWADYVKDHLLQSLQNPSKFTIGLVKINKNIQIPKQRTIEWDKYNVVIAEECEGPLHPFLTPFKEFIKSFETTTPPLWSTIDYIQKPEMVERIPRWSEIRKAKSYNSPAMISFDKLKSEWKLTAYVKEPLNERDSLYIRAYNQIN